MPTRNLAHRVPQTKAQALTILERVIKRLRRKRNSYGAIRMVEGAMDQLQRSLVRMARKNEPLPRRKPVEVLAVKKDTIKVLRVARPLIHRQGFLAKPVKVYPYASTDVFCSRHRVNVFCNPQGRFDVIDALCNLPILAGVTEKAVREAVVW